MPMFSKPMFLKHCVIVGLCSFFVFGASGTASAIKMKQSAIKIEKAIAPSPLALLVKTMLSEHPTILMAQVDIDMAEARLQRNHRVTKSVIETSSVAEAQLLLQVATANMVSAKEQLAADLVSVIVQCLSYRDLNIVAKKRVQQITQFVKQIKNSRQIGRDDADAEKSAVYTAEALLTQALIQHAKVSSELIQALGDFRALTGVRFDPSTPFPVELPKSLPKNVDLASLVAKHPMVVATKLKVKAIKMHMLVADLTHSADQRLDNAANAVRTGTQDDDIFVALHFILPVQAQKNVRSDVPQIGHILVKDEQLANNVYRKVLGRVEAARGRYIVMSQTWKLWSQSSWPGKLDDQLKNLENIWKAGEISTTQFLVQFQQMTGLPLSGAQLKGDVWQAWVAWLGATGSVTQWLLRLK